MNNSKHLGLQLFNDMNEMFKESMYQPEPLIVWVI